VPRTVLIVDDHPSFRASARAILEADGFEIVGEAEDAASAVTAARKLRPEIVLLDVQLPDATGFDVVPQLTANGSGPTVVLVSSRDRADYGTLVDESGAAGFIAKADLCGPALTELLP
jgi:DNA-binding NarL/FixJ family response regulator